MKKTEPPEIIQADKALRLNLMIILALYLLLGLVLNYLIDWSLTQVQSHPLAIQELAERKRFVSTIVFGMWRSLPILLVLLFSFRVIASAKLPPGGMKRFPFTVPVMKGRQASMFGYLLMAASVMLLYRELLLLMRNAL